MAEDFDQLNKDFGDVLSASVIRNIYDISPQNARRTLDEINKSPSISEPAKERMLTFYVEQFDTLTRDEIDDCLKTVNYNEDAAIFSLLELVEKKNKIESEANSEKEREEAFTRIQNLFENVPREEIQQLLDKYDGNVNQTIDVLLLKIKEQEDFNQRQNQRIFLINDLAKRLKTVESRAEKALEEHNWDYEKACEQLSKEITNEKFEEYVRIYPDLDHQTISECLGPDDNENMERLNEKRAEKKIEDQKRKLREKQEEEARQAELARIEQEEKERRERAYQDRLREEQKKKEEEERASDEERKRLEAIRKQEEEQRRIEEEENRRKEELRKQKEEEEEKERKRLAEIEKEEQAKREAQEIAKKLDDVAFRRSTLATGLFKSEINREKKKVLAVDQQTRKDLDSFLRPGIGEQPGLVQKPIPKKPVSTSVLDFIQSELEPKKPAHIAEEIKEVSNSTQNSEVVKLTLENTIFDWGKYIILNWKHTGFATPSDWIGLFKKGENTQSNYIDYAYVTLDAKNPSSGSMAFQAPKFSGEFEFRYFTFGTYQVFGISEVFKVGPQYKMTAEVGPVAIKIKIEELSVIAPNSFKTWIAMYTSDKSAHNDFYTYQWVVPNTDYTSFSVPKCGKWYFRLFNNTSRYDFLTSCEAFVEGDDKIELKQTTDNLFVSFDLKSVDINYDSPWIGIYRKEETRMNMYENYKYMPSAKGEFKMHKLIPGDWEARLFSTAHNGVISTSNTIHVPK